MRKVKCICGEAGKDGTQAHTTQSKRRFRFVRWPKKIIDCCTNHAWNYAQSSAFEEVRK